KDDMVLVQVKKGNDSEQLILPLVDNVFQGDIPLYFGEGLHTISVQVFNEIDELYYDSAIIYAHNPSTIEFAEVMKTKEYIERGITIHKPDLLQNKVYDQQSYHIAGEIDQTVEGADEITYIIVTVSHLEDDLESG